MPISGDRRRRKDPHATFCWTAILTGFLWLVASIAAAGTEEHLEKSAAALPSDPKNARYEIEGEGVSLVNGMAEAPAAPGSAIMVRTQVFGSPVFGDLDGDGDVDAVLWLVHQTGGSGTFYYVAAAINENGIFRGTRAVLLGDRIEPGVLLIEHRIVTVRFARRRPTAPMVAPPTVNSFRHFTSSSEGLLPVAGVLPGDALIHGWLVVGHEVRTFRPCDDSQALWLTGPSASIGSFAQAYRKALPGAAPYTPLFVTFVGRRVRAPVEGFGSRYTGGFEAREIVQTWSAGNCISDRIVIGAPAPGSNRVSPIVVRGWATSAWFFEGEIILQLLDGDRNVLSRGFATAQSDWMTNGLVLFEGTLSFRNGASVKDGILVVKRNNPSDHRNLDEEIAIPLHFR